MSRALKAGDSVRVTVRNRLKDYLPGEMGEVLAGPETLPNDRRRYYLVMLYRLGHHLRSAVFADDEIEPDV
jgi:hypothetical protein